MVMPVGRSLVFSGSQAKNISYPTDHRQKIFRILPIKGLPITLASSLSPLNVPKTGFPWSIPPDLARLSQPAAEIGVSTGENRKNASPVKGGAQKSRRSEDQVAFHLA